MNNPYIPCADLTGGLITIDFDINAIEVDEDFAFDMLADMDDVQAGQPLPVNEVAQPLAEAAPVQQVAARLFDALPVSPATREDEFLSDFGIDWVNGSPNEGGDEDLLSHYLGGGLEGLDSNFFLKERNPAQIVMDEAGPSDRRHISLAGRSRLNQRRH